MTRIATFLLFLLLVGCEQSSQKSGDLTPYLQLTQGTPVVVHLIATNSTAGRAINFTTQGTLYSITPEVVRIREQPDKESVGYSREMVRKIELTK